MKNEEKEKRRKFVVNENAFLRDKISFMVLVMS